MPSTAPVATTTRRAVRATRRRPADGSFGSSEGRRCGPHARAGLRGREARALREPRHAALGLRNAERVLVDLDHLAGHVRPGETLGALARGLGHRRAPVGVEGQRPQGLAERHRVADRHEHAVQPVAGDVAIAGDVRCHHRGAGGERLREHHAEALAAERGRAEQVGLAQQAPLLGVVHGPGDLHALRLQEQRLDLLDRGPGHREARLDPGAAQRLEGAQQHGKALALLGAADEQDLQLLVRAQVIGARGGKVHPVRHDPVAPAVVALRGPARGLGHRDAGAQLRVDPARAEEVRGELVRERGWSSRCGRCQPPARAPPRRRTRRPPARSARAREPRRSCRCAARGRSTPIVSPSGPVRFVTAPFIGSPKVRPSGIT